MKTIEQIKEAIIKHEAIVSYLNSQYIPFVKTLNIEHEYDEQYDHNAVDIFKNLTSLNAEEMVIRDNIVQLVEQLNVSLNNKADFAKQHNKNIDQQIDKVEKDFENEMSDVKEIKISSRMDLSFKNVEKIDREHFVNAYLSLGITHYNIGNEKHSIYYNAEIYHFNTLKEDIFKSVPLNVQKKYPSFVGKIQNKKLRTEPCSNTDLFEVISCKKTGINA